MDNNIKYKEIVYCDLKFSFKKKQYEVKEVVYKLTDGCYHNKRILSQFKINESVKVDSIKIISRLGFENNSKGFTEVEGSNEKRNKITGAYE